MIILPSLEIVPAKYNGSTLLSQIPIDGTGDFTVTRALNTATRVNSLGNIELVDADRPRLDYLASDGTVGCPALLVEPSAQNIVQSSEAFDDAYWSKVRCTASPNQTISPNGALTSEKLIMNNGVSPTVADTDGLLRNGVITSAAYRFSIFAKAAEFTGFKARENLVNGSFMDVNLTNGAITNPDTAQFISPLAENYGNGWYRISWTSPTITNLNKYSIRVGSTGNGTSGIFIWGYQVESGSVATSYIPTTTAAVTRNADVISVSGAVSGSIGQTQGTMYAEVDVRNWVNSGRIFSISDGTSNNRIMTLFNSSNRFRVIVDVSGSSAQADISSASLSNGIHKIAVGYAANDVVFYVDGVLVGSDNTANIPACSQVFLGKIETAGSTLLMNDRIRAATLYTTRLTNTQLALLTSPYTSYSSMASALSYTLG